MDDVHDVIPRSINASARGLRLSYPEPWPETTAGRAFALKSFMQRHGLSYVILAERIGISVSTLVSWTNGRRVDLVLSAREETVSRLLQVVRTLEPDWSDDDLWRWFGVPEGRRHVWTLNREPVAPSTMRIEKLAGDVISSVPMQVRLRVGDRSGLILYDNDGEWIAMNQRVVTPTGWQMKGRIISMTPLL